LHGEENSAWLLSGELWEDSKVVRELANSYRYNVLPQFIKLAEILYFDRKKGRLKIGATNSSRPGGLRRLDRVFSQLDLTYDVFGMDAEMLRAILPPKEFNRWLPKEVNSQAIAANNRG
jgi:hypothetical protein